ncbi:MAG: hypothetical protein M1820_010917 [Bogoriella megaspora]|nr:MAG: hypothetical protein M1820_010917 [Bogoriella megaspora]
MAVYPSSIPGPLPQATAAPNTQPDPREVNIWTQETTERLRALQISTGPSPVSLSVPRGASTSLHIPLDEPASATHGSSSNDAKQVHTDTAEINQPERSAFVRRRSSLQRDSMKRREALLKGKEGSRRRQRWENDRLLHVPNVQPPLPSDWEVRPTYPVRSVPYFLAPLWDERIAKRQSHNKKRADAAHSKTAPLSEADKEAARVQRELRAKLKKAKGAKNLLMDLEETIRSFIQKWEEKADELERSGAFDNESVDECALDSESSDGEEIVFVGRDLAMKERKMSKEPRGKDRKAEDEGLRRDKMVFDALVDDHGAAFARWLLHMIGVYYGLKTWSVTVGNPARRETYVGIEGGALRSSPDDISDKLPRPLWGLI